MKIGHITAPHFCAGVVMADDRDMVVEAAPIVKYMKHWAAHEITNYCLKKHWRLEWTFT